MADEKEKKGCCEKVGDGFANFAKFLFNRETGQVMGRSGESWLKIGIFYLIFYGFLAAFFSAMLTVFLKTLNDPGEGDAGAPKLIQFIENKPGLTYTKIGNWKLSDFRNGSDTTDLQAAYNTIVTNIFNKYNVSGKSGCEDSDTGMPKGTECTFKTSLLGECGPSGAPAFGVQDNAPCVYVRINKVFGWVPKATEGAGNYLKLKCDVEDGVTVTPAGFHIGSFPFRGQKDFELPIVAVKIDTSKVLGDKVICQLEGPNIEVSDSSVPHRAYAKVEIL